MALVSLILSLSFANVEVKLEQVDIRDRLRVKIENSVFNLSATALMERRYDVVETEDHSESESLTDELN